MYSLKNSKYKKSLSIIIFRKFQMQDRLQFTFLIKPQLITNIMKSNPIKKILVILEVDKKTVFQAPVENTWISG